jgi:glutamate-ammonia-ligase adenylyltransferase
MKRDRASERKAKPPMAAAKGEIQAPDFDSVYERLAAGDETRVSREQFEALLGAAPARKRTLIALTRLFDALEERLPSWRDLVSSPEALRLVFAITGQSAYFTEMCEAEPSYLRWLIEEGELQRVSFPGTFSSLLGKELGSDVGRLSEEEFLRIVRVFRRREMLRIGMRDILNLAPIETISAELSNLADVLIARCLQRATVELRGRGASPPIAVIGMGKLGGKELNFSSDVDLVFVGREEDEEDEANLRKRDAASAGPATLADLSPPAGSSASPDRIASRLIGLLTESTPDGYVFRVDVRLRPQGGAGPLVHTVPAAEEYYGTWGQPWERQALLKARFVAGDAALGERFLRAVEPFTYRRHVDPIEVEETLGSIQRMRRRYRAPRGDGKITRDVKVGRGGIREVEFIVQAIQILYGGRYPEIRHPNTFEALRRIHQSGLLSAEDYDVLHGGYAFVRRIEHRIQMEREFHSFSLPESPEGLDRLGRKLGYPDGKPLLEEYQKRTRSVAEIYDSIFSRETTSEDLNVLLTSPERGDAGVRLLGGMGFSDPERARKTLHLLAQDPEAAHLSSKLQRLFREILPRLTAELSASPEPDRALRNLREVLDHYGARSQLYSVLAQHPAILELFVTLGASSQHLCNLLVQDPALVDLLLTPEVVSTDPGEDILARVVRDFQAGDPDRSLLDHLRRLRRAGLVRIGSRYLLRVRSLQETCSHLTALAEFVLRQVIDDVGRSLMARFGQPVDEYDDPVPLAVLGLGKLGGGELNFTSDLDLIFVHGEVDTSDSDWQGDISVGEYFARWAQGVIQALEETTAHGQLYQADCRLRPHGRNAPLVVSAAALRTYLTEEGALWERQAWTRARVVYGEEVLGPELDEIRQKFAYARDLSREDRAEIQRIRERVREERQVGRLKVGPGGIVDVEFLVQALLLEHGKDHPEIRERNTFAALDRLEEAGILPARNTRILREGYHLFRDIENRLQIMDNLSVEDFPDDSTMMESFVKRLYYKSNEEAPPADDWLAMYRTKREEVAKLVDGYFLED